MRILHIIPNLNKGGAERLVLDICNELQKKKYINVKLITFTSENQYNFLSKNLDLEVIPASIKLSLLRKNIIDIDLLQKAIENFKPDIIHTHLYEAEIISRSCKYTEAKWFSTIHGYANEFIKPKINLNKDNIIKYYTYNYLIKRYKQNCGNHFIFVSEKLYEYFKFLPFKHTVLNNAINLENFQSVKNKKDHIIKLINVGSFNDNKNQIYLIQVAKELKIKGINFILYLIGEGKNKLTLKKLVQSLNLENNIFFPGNIDNVSTYYKMSNIYVHSAIKESFGLTILEASATGLPIVCLDAGGNTSIVKNGINGFLIQSDSSYENFIDKILNVFENLNFYSENAKRISKKFDIKLYVNELIKIYSV